MPSAAIAAAAAVHDRRGVPARYTRFTLAVTAAAVAALALAATLAHTHPWATDPLFWLLAALCLAGEALPIRLARRTSFDEVTISTAFAFAVLLAFGALPAMALYALVTLTVDLARRREPTRITFNAAQYTLTLATPALICALLIGAPDPDTITGNVPTIVLAAAALFATNHILAATGSAILTNHPTLPYIRSDLGFYTWTSGFQLALAPVLIASAHQDLLLLPLLTLPLIAIFLGGRAAVVNQHRALHDDLTDLPNRRRLSEQLDDALEQAADADPLALVLVDLDDFKAINDTLGHDLGDALLHQVAARLRAAAPADAVVGRLGGDEFAMIVPGADAVAAQAVTRRLLERLEAPFDVSAFALDVRASAGVAVHPGHGTTRSSLLKCADVALYRAKELGSHVEVYADGASPGADGLVLAEDLRRGVQAGELVLHYQPKLALDDHRPDGVEALVRWQHPELGLLAPAAFIPVAEQSNLIKAVTDWVLESVIAQCASWRASGLDLRVSVNLSSRSLLDRTLSAQVHALLARHDVPSSMLQVEVTETRIVADFTRARRVLQELQVLGVRIAIDDFGTGYSSLAQLQQLPADEIKIDKSFVMHMETNANDAAIVRSTIGLGRNLALDVTAEGVEDEETLDRLVDLGCDYVQGFLLGRPAPADECARDLRAHRAHRRFQRRPLATADQAPAA